MGPVVVRAFSENIHATQGHASDIGFTRATNIRSGSSWSVSVKHRRNHVQTRSSVPKVSVRLVGALLVVGAASSACGVPEDRDELSAAEDELGASARAGLALAPLGRLIFEDKRLSASGTQSCASCHVDDVAFTGNNNPAAPLFPVSTGAFPHLLGVRNTPTAKYMAFSPSFGFVEDEGEFVPVGGQFWDGRADTLADQAKQPFLNPREMALPDRATVIQRIEGGPYAALFRFVFGRHAFADVDRAYDNMARAVEAFERTERFSPFSSKFDLVLTGRAHFTRRERRGFELFKDPDKGNCIACHVGDEQSRNPRDWLFTDFTYDNLGIPRNALIPDNEDPEFFDLGLCNQPELLAKVPPESGAPEDLAASLCGAFKVPSLRNVALTAPYMHNGKFERLRDVVDFYVTRDTSPDRWYSRGPDGSVAKFDDLPDAYHANVNTSEAPYDRAPGEEPALTPDEIDDVVAFLGTLTDGYRGLAFPEPRGFVRGSEDGPAEMDHVTR
jgi:cytochrome c peroxidase